MMYRSYNNNDIVISMTSKHRTATDELDVNEECAVTASVIFIQLYRYSDGRIYRHLKDMMKQEQAMNPNSDEYKKFLETLDRISDNCKVD